jgi:hypothetical protein
MSIIEHVPNQLGYADTPVIPETGRRVHDRQTPQPRVVTPGAHAGDAPSDAVVLFDGHSLAGWESVRGGGVAKWEIVDGAMQVVPGTGDVQTTHVFGDCQLHVEFRSPGVVKGHGQGRGNSGVFLMGTYEVQVLDCRDNPTYADGTTGAFYGQYPPLVNACRAPGEWSTYDIIWRAPRFDGDRVVNPASATVILNGVVVQNHQVLLGQTNHKVLPAYHPHGLTGPLKLQDHGDLVRFRNIWYRPL